MYDDGWVRCLDWDGAGLEIPENGVCSWGPIHRATEIVDLEEKVRAHVSVDVENGDECDKEVSWEADAVIVGDVAVKREGSAGVQYRLVTADRVRQRTQRHFGSLGDLLGPTTPRNDGEGLRERLCVHGTSKAARGEAAPTEEHLRTWWIDVDSRQRRFKQWKDVVAECDEQRFSDFPLRGFPGTLTLITMRMRHGDGPWLFFDSSAEITKSASWTVSITRCGCSWVS